MFMWPFGALRMSHGATSLAGPRRKNVQYVGVVLNSLFPKWPTSREKRNFRETFAEPSPDERKKVLLPSSPNPDLCEVKAELSRNFRNKIRYNAGFPASATYDGSHSIEAGLR